MEKIGAFIPDAVPERPLKKPHEYIQDEMVADVTLFPKDVQKLIQKGTGAPMTAGEQDRYLRARKQWWEDKYGFPYEMKTARNDLVTRKYGEPAESVAARVLQNDLLDALQHNHDEKAAELRKSYLERYPDQLEGVEALFGLTQYFSDDSAIAVSRKEGRPAKERLRLFQNVTEYNFLLTDFIRSNSGDKAFLQKFWGVLETIARQSEPDHLRQFQMLQRAIVTQVATGKIFEKIGEHTRLSHPTEDAFNAIDLWIEGAAVQIKGTVGTEAGFLKTDNVSFPGIEVKRDDVDKLARTYHINSQEFHQAQQFHAKLSEYRKSTHKDVEGYFLVVPYNKIDFITGEPAPDLVEFVREQVKTTFT